MRSVKCMCVLFANDCVMVFGLFCLLCVVCVLAPVLAKNVVRFVCVLLCDAVCYGSVM